MIKVIIAGRVGGDAELKYLEKGDAIVNFSVASSRKVKGAEHTEWIRCAMFGKRAEAIHQYITKGSAITVTGDLSTRSYDKDGQTRFSLECRVDDVALQGSAGDKAASAGSSNGTGQQRPANGAKSPARQQAPADDFGGDDEIPF